ncbi:MAG: hypothetical protein MK085_06825, partial [Phycisphaerales bacterium]|nr:hypothetical protein [Phycisphaerales bacterium]
MRTSSREQIRFVPMGVMEIGRKVIRYRIGPQLFIAGGLLAVLAPLFWLFVHLDNGIMLPILIVAWPLLTLLFVGLHDRWRRHLERRAARRSGDEVMLALMRLRKPLGILKARTDWEAALKSIRESSDPPPIAVCEESLEKRILAIAEMEHFPEPESLAVGGITRWGLSTSVVLVGGILFSSCFFSWGMGVVFIPGLNRLG